MCPRAIAGNEQVAIRSARDENIIRGRKRGDAAASMAHLPRFAGVPVRIAKVSAYLAALGESLSQVLCLWIKSTSPQVAAIAANVDRPVETERHNRARAFEVGRDTKPGDVALRQTRVARHPGTAAVPRSEKTPPPNEATNSV